MRSKVVPLSRDELLNLPAAVDLATAARALGIGRSTAQELAKTGQFPVRVLRLGNAYKIASADLLTLLGLSPTEGTAQAG
jgi:hypothetical protein